MLIRIQNIWLPVMRNKPKCRLPLISTIDLFMFRKPKPINQLNRSNGGLRARQNKTITQKQHKFHVGMN